MNIYAESRNQHATTPAKRRDHARFARSGAFEPTSPERGRAAKEYEEKRVHPAEIELGPVARRGGQRVDCAQRLAPKGGGVAGARNGLAKAGCSTDGAPERQPKDAEAIRHPDAQMDAKR